MKNILLVLIIVSVVIQSCEQNTIEEEKIAVKTIGVSAMSLDRLQIACR